MTPDLTPRERFIAARERRPPPAGRVPTFALVFFVTIEAVGNASCFTA